MNSPRTGFTRDVLWRSFAAAMVAVALHAVDCSAFQARGAPGLRGVFSALLRATPNAERDGVSAPDGELALQLVDFDLGERAADLCIGAGWFASLTTSLEYFTAMGLRLPDIETPIPLDGEDEPETMTSLAVGPWAATGLGWRPLERVRLSVEARWNAENLALLDRPADRCPFQAGLSLAMNW